jgi:hypothetical protein
VCVCIEEWDDFGEECMSEVGVAKAEVFVCEGAHCAKFGGGEGWGNSCGGERGVRDATEAEVEEGESGRDGDEGGVEAGAGWVVLQGE